MIICLMGGFITFDDNGEMITSSKLEENQINKFDIKESPKIMLSKGVKRYMSYHRERVFLGSE